MSDRLARDRMVGDDDEAAAWAAAFTTPEDPTPDELLVAYLQARTDGDDAAAARLRDLVADAAACEKCGPECDCGTSEKEGTP